jgi:hypothetical protein
MTHHCTTAFVSVASPSGVEIGQRVSARDGVEIG